MTERSPGCLQEQADGLAARPTWLFSSGPADDPPQPEVGQAVQIEPADGQGDGRGHRLFGGKIDKSRLGTEPAD